MTRIQDPVEAHRGRYECYVGFASPPNSFECSPQHFLHVAPDAAVGVIQHVIHAPEFEYTGLSEHGTDEARSELDWAVLKTAGIAAKPGCGRLLATIR